MLGIATGVPRPVEVAIRAERFASGSAARIVEGPEKSELDALASGVLQAAPEIQNGKSAGGESFFGC